MKKAFIGNIKITDHKILKNTEIDIHKNSTKYIIITGKNGSGKTELLNSIYIYLNSLNLKEYRNVVNLNKDINECNKNLNFLRNEEILTEVSKGEINKLKNRINFYNLKKIKFCNGIDIKIYNDDELQKKFDMGEFIFEYYKSRRNIDIIKSKSEDKNKVDRFIEFLYQLKDRKDEAIAIEDEEEEIIIDRWFNMFERLIKHILMKKDVKFYFDDIDSEYKIKEKNREAYNLYELSDGHSAILKIFIELMISMEKSRTNKYDVEGIVLIDEIEKHIHPELQKIILPLLNEFFPNVQFIVTTMSSYVKENMKSCFIYDLDKK